MKKVLIEGITKDLFRTATRSGLSLHALQQTKSATIRQNYEAA